MKQAELLKLGDQVWVRKRRGYRIKCRQYEADGRVEVLMPSESEAPMESDVAGWRVAHKLCQADGVAADGKPTYVDITLVDDLGEVVPYYVTGQIEILNRDADLLPAPDPADQDSARPGEAG